MEIIQGIQSFRKKCDGCAVVALGNFDGVHLGHREIINTTVKTAKKHGAKSAVLIFSPHPLSVLAPDKAPALLMTMEDRIHMLGQVGVDYVIVHPFNREFAGMPPESFATEVLHGKLGVSGVVVGFDYSFGRRGLGNPAELKLLGERLGFTVEVVNPVSVHGEPVGSTAVRKLLLEGRVEAAADMLGYPFYLRGEVVHGDGRGRTLGFPTANLQVPCEIIRPAHGVYLTKALLGEERFWAVTNVGKRPTFCKTEPSVEVHLLDTQKNLYGHELMVEFIQKIREEKAFSGPEALRAQIRNDIDLARTIIAKA
ncbi:bifunctional riboflavin kinase/FAD synthetase [Dethiobacter alkaliphilus]|uniref:Riboflavin biosynthesis protein n=1 Tax=Dethiobacter alkaliphilus AHT 1 TaxID=555088 RepID=C0GIW3_DETAL|nr:bifunctional riboflavin kinase/FAD synthetase [Dethiobacter alkaliphilus]EEG76777.1 riboflavin biosynthesis protein RibF [Dethiobacter alkaliphilus AHT 1]